MTQQPMHFIDIKTESETSAGLKKSVFTHSDNSFRFDFFSDNPSTSQEKIFSTNNTETAPSQISFTTRQCSPFAFNFQIPATPAEDMDTAERTDPFIAHEQLCVQEEKSCATQKIVAESSEQSKSKKKKKAGKKKASQVPHEPTGVCQGSEELTADEQLNRQLDWCVEQLELGLKTQKGTPKQKEEASRALKTLRSSKAPLVKKRQVMRTMTGDYRKKMEDEKTKQFKLIQSEIASARVNVVSDSPKKSVFHRRAEVKTQSATTEDKHQRTEAQEDRRAKEQTLEPSLGFVFVPSKENFSFNFF